MWLLSWKCRPICGSSEGACELLLFFESTALADVSNRSVGIGHSVLVDTYTIPQDVVDLCLNACKSSRNLAGRLASRLFTKEERCVSNTRGMCGKKALNGHKVKAIYSCCIANYPLERLETSSQVEKEMRNAVDEVCRKTKIPKEAENLLPAC